MDRKLILDKMTKLRKRISELLQAFSKRLRTSWSLVNTRIFSKVTPKVRASWIKIKNRVRKTSRKSRLLLEQKLPPRITAQWRMVEKKFDDIPSAGKRALKVGLIVIGVFVLAIIVVPLLPRPTSTPDNTDPDFDPDVVVISTTTPDEEKPGEDFDWRGRESEPKYIRIPKINVDGYVQKVGVDQNTQIAVPTNIHLAGWFVGSVRPGQKGLSIIDGHYDGRTNPGLFEDLGTLSPEDTFSVELGDGQVLNYKVVTVTTYSVNEAAQHLFSQHSDVSSQLNLITCGGTFDEATEEYAERVIVTAALL